MLDQAPAKMATLSLLCLYASSCTAQQGLQRTTPQALTIVQGKYWYSETRSVTQTLAIVQGKYWYSETVTQALTIVQGK